MISKALYEFTKTAGDQGKDLYELNKDVYNMLRYGVKAIEDAGANTITVTLIDWDNCP